MTKRCSRCEQTKELTEFNRATANRDGYLNYCRQCQSDYAAQRNYGITRQQIEEMRSAQANRCLICGREVRLVVDHSHVTGEVRGLLCHGCNTGIGLLGDDPDRLLAAAAYLLSRATAPTPSEV